MLFLGQIFWLWILSSQTCLLHNVVYLYSLLLHRLRHLIGFYTNSFTQTDTLYEWRRRYWYPCVCVFRSLNYFYISFITPHLTRNSLCKADVIPCYKLPAALVIDIGRIYGAWILLCVDKRRMILLFYVRRTRALCTGLYVMRFLYRTFPLSSQA